jgi:hypothetical protein
MNLHTKRSASARCLVISASLFVAVACTRTASSSTGASSSTVEATPTASSTNPDVRSIDGFVMGTGHYPGFTVQAPSPWSTSDGYFVINHTGGVVLGISVWDVGQVSRNPCHWRGHLYDPGPTVDDLVAALSAQPTRDPTTPTDVTLAGYHGRYVQWSVPADMVVTGNSNFAGCDVKLNGHRDYVSWFGQGMGDRWQQMAGQVDRLWVLDVSGQRLVVDATYSPNTSQAQRDELGQIVNSLRFTT